MSYYRVNEIKEDDDMDIYAESMVEEDVDMTDSEENMTEEDRTDVELTENAVEEYVAFEEPTEATAEEYDAVEEPVETTVEEYYTAQEPMETVPEMSIDNADPVANVTNEKDAVTQRKSFKTMMFNLFEKKSAQPKPAYTQEESTDDAAEFTVETVYPSNIGLTDEVEVEVASQVQPIFDYRLDLEPVVEEIPEKVTTHSTIAQDMQITGNLQTNGDLDVLGIVLGNITASGRVTISGSVKGNIQAYAVAVKGGKVVAENIQSETDTDIAKGSVVKANIFSQNLTMDSEVKGDLAIEGDCSIFKSTKFEGNVTARRISLTSGAIVNGKMTVMDGALSQSLT